MSNPYQTVFMILSTAMLVGLFISTVKLWIELEAMKRSTHKVTFIDPTADALSKMAQEEDFETLTEETKKKLQQSENGDFDIVA